MTLYALDGTNNRLDSGPRKWTHVALIAAAYGRSTPVPTIDDTLGIQGDRVMYQAGVGSGWRFNQALGGFTGWGAKHRARQAYQKICQNYADEDATAEDLTIDIVGFSRGAATALHLANLIYTLGIRQPQFKRNSFMLYRPSVGWIWGKDWKRLGQSDIERLRRRLNAADMPAKQLLVHGDIVVPRIRFLGLFDTVSSFAVPVDTRILDLQSLGFGFRLHLPPNVATCSHALALDERRKSFRNVRVNPADMRRSKALRSTEVGKGAAALLWIIAGWWGLFALLPSSLGWTRPWTIIMFVGALSVAVTHGFRGAVDDAAALERADASRDVTHQTKQELLLRVAKQATAPEHRSARNNGVDPTDAMAPALGALFGLIGLALVDWFGGFDSSAIGPWDYGAAVAWAALSAVGLAITAPALAPDVTSLRSSSAVVGLTARRFSGFAVVTAWLLATWWVGGVVTNWWDHDQVAPWLWRGLVVALVAATITAVVAKRRSRHNSPALTPSEISDGFDTQQVHEVWFRGNHTDIGGGGAPGLCDYPLQWMIAEADRAGLEIDLGHMRPALDQRIEGTNPNQVGPTFDPIISRARRLLFDGDFCHVSVRPSDNPVPEDPETMVRFNRRRLFRGVDLQYDPVTQRSRLKRAFARRFMSPYVPRFVRPLDPAAAIDEVAGDHSAWRLESSAGRIFETTQQRRIDLANDSGQAAL